MEALKTNFCTEIVYDTKCPVKKSFFQVQSILSLAFHVAFNNKIFFLQDNFRCSTVENSWPDHFAVIENNDRLECWSKC